MKKQRIRFLLLLLTAVLFAAPALGATDDSAWVPPPCNVHVWGGAETIQAATCTQTGYGVRTCQVCRAQERIILEALGHDYAKIAETAPTCKDKGTVTWQCSRCGLSYSEQMPALGHNYGEPKTDIPATCTEKGRTVRVCSRNEAHIWYGELQPLGHDFGAWQEFNGIRQRTCARCGLTETDQTVQPATTSGVVREMRGLPPAMPRVTLEAEPPKALPYQENSQIQVVLTLTNTGSAPVTIKSLTPYNEGDTVQVADWMLKPLQPGRSEQTLLLLRVGPGDVSRYAPEWIHRFVTAVCVDEYGTECGDTCMVLVPRLKTGASLLLIPEDTTGMTGVRYGICTVEMYIVNNGTVPLRDLNLQSLDARGIGVPEDSFASIGIGERLDVGEARRFQLLLTVRDLDANDGIAWRQVMADAAREDNGAGTGDTADVAVVVDTLFEGKTEDKAGPTQIPEVPVPEVSEPPATDMLIPPVTLPPEEYPVPGDLIPPVTPPPEEGEAALQLEVKLAEQKEEGFAPGEQAAFNWTLTNTGEVGIYYGDLSTCWEFPELEADDPAFYTDKTKVDEQSGVWLEPGQSLSGTVFVTVGEEHAEGEDVGMYFQATGERTNGKRVASNPVIEHLFLAPKTLTLVKEVTSAPKNGSYYTEGEEVTYLITAVNGTRHRIDSVIIRDPLSGSSDPLAIGGMVEPGEKVKAVFTYTVTAPDVEAGKITNTAVCDYLLNRELLQILSNTVTVLTKGGAPREDYCVPVLTGHGGNVTETELRLCGTHLETARRARALTDVREAAALWQEAVHDLYGQLYLRTGSSAFIEEQAAFDVLMERERAVAEALYPDEPGKGYEAVIEQMTEKCVNLCYELHTAPSDRRDSVFAGNDAPLEDEAADPCLWRFTQTDGGAVIHTALCEKHRDNARYLESAARAVRAGSNRAGLIRSARNIWMTETELLIQQGGLKAGDSAAALSGLRAALDGYLLARESTLSVLYPERTDIVEEVLMNEAKAWNLRLCGDIRK